MLAMTLSRKPLPDHLGTKLVIACHDELVIECPEEQAKEVARFLQEAVAAGMKEVLNSGLGSEKAEYDLFFPRTEAPAERSSPEVPSEDVRVPPCLIRPEPTVC
jgi:hypothetical protein